MRIVGSLFFIKVMILVHAWLGMYKKSILSLGSMITNDVFSLLIQM